VQVAGCLQRRLRQEARVMPYISLSARDVKQQRNNPSSGASSGLSPTLSKASPSNTAPSDQNGVVSPGPSWVSAIGSSPEPLAYYEAVPVHRRSAFSSQYCCMPNSSLFVYITSFLRDSLEGTHINQRKNAQRNKKPECDSTVGLRNGNSRLKGEGIRIDR